MSEKKVVSRNIAIGLGIMCIILAVGLVGTFAYYMSIITDKNSMISSLEFQMTDKDSEISSLNSQKTSQENEINDLTSILNLNKNTTWVSQTVNTSGYWEYSTDAVFYAGYVSVWIQVSTSSTTAVRVSWSSNGANYDKTTTVGTSGKVAFPVLPTTVTIEIENSNLFTVTVTYHY
jgi:hypothetical protein